MKLNATVHRSSGTTRRVLYFGLIISIGLAAADDSAHAQSTSRFVGIVVNVTPRHPGGAAWDAFGGAPDIALCVNSAYGQRCFANGEQEVASPSNFARGRCQDAFHCEFRVQVPTTGPFSVVVYDVDVSQHDTIGSCVIQSDSAGGVCGSARLTIGGSQSAAPSVAATGTSHTPVSASDFNGIQSAVSRAILDDAKVSVVRDLLRGGTRWFTGEQAATLMRASSLDGGRVEMGALLYPRLVDPENFYLMTQVFILSSSADDLRRRVGQ